MSHPVWVRGLKQCTRGGLEFGLRSHPVWVRGLKLNRLEALVARQHVAPRVGAWIETYYLSHCHV